MKKGKPKFNLAEINDLSNYKPLDFKQSNLIFQKIEQMEKYEIEIKSLRQNANVLKERNRILRKEIYKLTNTYKTRIQKFKDNKK